MFEGIDRPALKPRHGEHAAHRDIGERTGIGGGDRLGGAITAELDHLIRDGAITAKMGTSLIIDFGYAGDAIWNLVQIGNLLYGSANVQDKVAEELLALTEEDVEDIHREDIAHASS